MRSKTYMSKINLQSGILTVENRKSRDKKRICSEVSVNSPGNPGSQSRRRNGRLWWEGFAEKDGYNTIHRFYARSKTSEESLSIPHDIGLRYYCYYLPKTPSKY